MRTLELLKGLTEKELKLIEAKVLTGKRKSLVPLLKELKKFRTTDNEPDDAELFRKTFGKPYSKNKNYLLRNELRLLNEIIYNYLVEVAFNQHLTKNPGAYNQWLLQSFYNRGMKSMFEADVEKSISVSLADNRPEESSVIFSLKSLWQIQNLPRSVEALKEQQQVIKQFKQEEERRFFFRIREAEAREAFVQHLLDYVEGKQRHNSDDARTSGQSVFDMSKLENSDWRARYLLLKKHAHQTKGILRIEILKEMQEIEEAPYFKGDYGLNAQIVTLTNLALEYLLLEQFELADKYMEQCIERCCLLKQPVPIGNIQNYIANQVILKRYEKGIEIFKKFEDIILKSRSAENILILAGFCYIFLNKPDQAMELVPVASKVNVNNMVVSRLMIAIIFFLRGDYELANNECLNLKRSTYATSLEKKNDVYTLIIQWLGKYFSAFTKGAAVKQKEISALRKILETHRVQIMPHLKKEFALLWLMREIEAGI